MKVVSKVDEFGLTKGETYEVIEESAGYYKIFNDNGNKVYRDKNLFEKQNKKPP